MPRPANTRTGRSQLARRTRLTGCRWHVGSDQFFPNSVLQFRQPSLAHFPTLLEQRLERFVEVLAQIAIGAARRHFTPFNTEQFSFLADLAIFLCVKRPERCGSFRDFISTAPLAAMFW